MTFSTDDVVFELVRRWGADVFPLHALLLCLGIKVNQSLVLSNTEREEVVWVDLKPFKRLLDMSLSWSIVSIQGTHRADTVSEE